jgi:hypothetical protein
MMIASFLQLPGNALDLLLQSNEPGKGFQGLRVQGLPFFVFHLLGQVAQRLPPGDHYLSLVGLLPGCNQVQEGGLACPVTSHQANPFTRVHLETDPVEQDIRPEPYAYVVDRYHPLNPFLSRLEFMMAQK